MDFGALLVLLEAPDYTIAREILQRGFAVLFLIAFLNAWNEFPALLGEKGLPAGAALPRAHHREAGTESLPVVAHSVLRPEPADRLRPRHGPRGHRHRRPPQAGPAWVPIPVFLTMWWFYFSISSIGQRFYGFGWESLPLLEAGFLVGFLGSHAVAPPRCMILLLRWFTLRVEFGAGMIKMRGDSSWRDLTAMNYHHQTQPMPNPLSRTAHLMPTWWHKGETLGDHIVQLIAPWGCFFLFPQPIASFAATAIIITSSRSSSPATMRG